MAATPSSAREPALPPPEFGGLAQSPGVANDVKMHHEDDEDDALSEPTGFVYVAPKFASTRETDAHKIAQRQKQIDMGKNTTGYANYTTTVSKHARVLGEPRHPHTPKVHKAMSKRCFDGQVRAWRRALHLWDVMPGDEHKLQVTPRPKPAAKRAKGRQQSPSTPEPAGDAPVRSTVEKSLFDAFEDAAAEDDAATAAAADNSIYKDEL